MSPIRRVRAGRLGAAGGLFILGALGVAAAARPADAGLGEDFQALVAAREGLLQALQDRQAADRKAGPAQDFYLYLDEGADRDDLNLVLRRAGGQWRAAYGQVPGWEQGTMQEWRGYYLSNRTGCDWRPVLRFGADAAGLALDGDRLAGPLAVAFRLDQTLDEKLPPGEPCGWWDKFIPTGYTIPRRETFTLDATVRPDGCFFDLVLENGVNWQPKPKGGKTKGKGKAPAEEKPAEEKPADEKPADEAPADVGAVRRPIFVQLLVPSTRFTVASVRTPTWNGGYHEGDAAGLDFKDGRLTGTLVIFLHQDGWVPWGGGKTYQHPPQVLRFKVDATLRHHVLSGAYTATGDMGEFAGAVRGKGGRAVTGRYAAAGQIGDQTGGLCGMMLDDPAPLREQVPAEPAVPAAAAAAARHVAARLNTVLHQVRALHLALQHYPLPLAEALAQTDTAAPAWESEKVDAAALAAYVSEARRLLAGVPAPDKADLAAPEPEGTGDSPSLGALAAPVKDDAVNILPGGASGEWYYLGRWQVVGPFEARVGLENDTGLVPEVVPAAGPGLVQPIDRFGAVRADAPTVDWQAIAYEGPRLAAPWEKGGFYTRFAGQVWYAAAEVQSDKARPIWFSLEAGDQAKLWVNGRLVWADAEKPWRYRARGRVVVPAALEAGVNRLLVRVDRDRRPSWVRLALTARRPSAGEPPPRQAVFAGPYVFPDAKPPLAWDIDAGTNVAWRKADLGGSVRPVLAGDALLLMSPPHTLFSADAATGAVRWSRETNVLELLDPSAAATWAAADGAARLALLKAREQDLGLERRFNDPGAIRVAEPVSDGQRVWVHAGTGAAACYDLSGDRRWIVRTNLAAAQMHLARGLLVIEGQATGTWPLPPDFSAAPQAKGRVPAVGVLVLDAATGQERRRWTLPGEFEGGWSRLMTAGSGAARTTVVLTSTGWIVDPAGGAPPVPMNLEYPGPGDEDYRKGGQIIGGRSGRPFSLTNNGDTLFMMAQEQGLAVRLWPAGPGRLGYAPLWESHYEHGGFGSFLAPAVATDRYLFVWNPVLERGPHCPDSRVELHVHDARTGRPLARLKPALESAVSHSVMPVVAGPYVYCFDAGGGTHGGLQGHGQVLVATADDRLQVVARNLMDVGTRASPVFAGERMYLRSPEALTCVAVMTAEGRRWQNERLAETLLGELGAAPVTAAPRRIAPAASLPLGPGVPVGKLLDGRATEFWLGAGPFPEGGDEAALAALRPQAGDRLTVGGQARPFEALSREMAFNEPPFFRRQYALQGTGDICPFFSTLVDPRAVGGPATGTGFLYTVLDNARDRIVIPTLKGKGLATWLAGERVRPDEPLHLGPGLYPFLVRIDPSYYVIEEKEILPPVDVEKALQAGALKDIGWPKTWQVIGALPPDAAPLAPDQLRAIPDKVTVGDRTYPTYTISEDGHTVYLTSLVDLREGEKPDVAGAPKEAGIGSPSFAYAFAAIECPADGMLYVTGSADWFMRWYVDGEVAYDTMKGGNAAATTALDGHPWAVRVTKGRHVLAVLVKPGTKGWSFTSLGGFSGQESKALAALRVPSKQKREEPDFRFAPAFTEVPHPPTRERRWQEQLRSHRARLEAVVRDLPGTDAARAAAGLLADIKG